MGPDVEDRVPAENCLRHPSEPARTDTLSSELLKRSGLGSRLVRKNASGDTRSLSFRDLARLIVVTESEIQTPTNEGGVTVDTNLEEDLNTST